MSSKKTAYAPPKVVTLDGNKIVELLGPVSAGSGSGSDTDCIPASWMGGC